MKALSHWPLRLLPVLAALILLNALPPVIATRAAMLRIKEHIARDRRLLRRMADGLGKRMKRSA